MSTRKIKDAKDLSSNELIYFKGHAKATYMSDGSTVEDAINNIKVGTGVDLSDYATKAEIPTVPTKVSELENDSKFITIEDVPEVSGPTKTSELTNDSGFITINDVPDIPSLDDYASKDYVDNSITELVDGAPETLNTLNELAAALKDNADIVDVLNQSISSKQDIISDIETIRQGAAKGATALQSYTEQYKGTITGINANGTSLATSGVANIPAASTSKYGVTKLSTSTSSTSTSLAATASAVKQAYDLANGKQDKLVSGINIKTINGTSILGGGNIIISGSGEGSSSNGNAYQLVNHVISGLEYFTTINPNTFYLISSDNTSDGSVEELAIEFGSEIAGIANEYLFQFTSGSEPTTLILPDSIKFNSDFTVEANKIYQISILNGLGTVMSWDI